MRRRIVTALFCDVVGSTARAEHGDAEAVLQAMLRYFAEARTAIEAHGGTVEKFIGDAVVGMFGVEVAHDDDALRAVRAAVEIRARVAAMGPELERVHGAAVRVRIAVNTGEVAAGVDPVSGRAVVVADAVNVAARLQQSAAPGEIVLGEQTHRLVRHDVRADALGPVAVRGRERAAGAYRLRDVLDEATRRERQAERPLVGREAELAVLGAAFADTLASGAGRIVTVIGEAGVGKSRIAQEVAARAGDAATVAYGATSSYGEGTTYAAVAQVLRAVTGAGAQERGDGVRTRLAALADTDGEGLAAIAGPALGLWDGPSAATDEVVNAVRALLSAAARRRPVIVVLDDVHWAESGLLDALPRLAATDGPVLLVVLARPDLLESRPDWPVTVRLAPLDEDAVATMLEGLLGPGRPELRRRVASAAQGNPLFLEQLVAMLADDGVLARGDAAPPAAALTDLALPPSLALLLTARLDRLPPTARAVAEHAAVVGVEFDAGAVTALCSHVAAPAVVEALGTLVTREFVAAAGGAATAGDTYRFRHVLLREAAYAGTSKAVRARLHEAHAAWLEDHGGGAAAVDGEIGHHLERTFRLRAELGPVDAATRALGVRAGMLVGAAGRRALDRGEAETALRALDRAVTLVDDGARPALAYALAVALVEVGDLERARALLGGLASGPDGDAPLRALAGLELGWVGNMLGSLTGSELRFQAERAIRAGAGDAGVPGRAHFLVGFLHFGDERHARAMPALAAAVERARAAGDGRLEAEAAYFLACSAFFAPAPPAEAAPFWVALEAETRERPALHAAAATGLALQRALQGRLADARALLSEAEEAYDDLGMAFHRTASDYCRVEVEMLAGAWDAAALAARAGYEARLAVGDRSFASGGAAYLATIADAAGRHADVAPLLAEASALAAPDDVQTQVRIAALQGTVLARAGRHAEAIAAADAAAALIDQHESPLIAAATLAERATVLRLAGHCEEANDALRRAVALHDRKGDVLGARRARARLGRPAPARSGA